MRIDQLPVTSVVERTDTLPISTDGVTKQASVEDIFDSALGDIAHNMDGGIFSVIIGDILVGTAYTPSACVKVGTRLYIINAPDHDIAKQTRTNTGKVVEINLANNTILNESDIVCGHGNSATYDSNTSKLYVAPVWDYENATGSGSSITVPAANYIYQYTNLGFTSPTKIATPAWVMAVSFDPVTLTLYILCYATSSVGYRIYKYTDNAFQLVSTISMDGVTDNTIFGASAATYNQDFAVYNGYFFMSSPRGYALAGQINESGATKVSKTFIVNRTDCCGFRRLGELEGWEFDSDGHLLAVDFAYIADNLYDAYVVEIPTPFVSPYFEYDTMYRAYKSAAIINSTTVNSFCNGPYQLKSLNQIRGMSIKPDTVTVQDDGTTITESVAVNIDGDLELVIVGHYQIPSLDIISGHLLIRPEDGADNPHTATHLLEITDTTNGPINVNRGGRITFGGQNQLRIKTARTNDLLIRPGYAFAFIAWRYAPGRVVDGQSALQMVFRIDSNSGPVMDTNIQLYMGTKQITI